MYDLLYTGSVLYIGGSILFPEYDKDQDPSINNHRNEASWLVNHYHISRNICDYFLKLKHKLWNKNHEIWLFDLFKTNFEAAQ